MDLESKFCGPANGVLTVTEGNAISGYASLFGVADQGGDTVAPGAYARSLEQLAQRGCRVKLLWQHDPGQPIGIWDEVFEDTRGLFVRGRILTELEKGREAVSLIEAGAIDGLSIGYRTRRAAKGAEGGRLLQELELWEVSVVTFPMLPEARVGAKGDLPGDPMRELAAVFRTARRELAGE